jgi:hypothetical protein
MTKWFLNCAQAMNPPVLPWVIPWLIWAIFGNADDGVYGTPAHRSDNGLEDGTWETFWWWWRRNPFHNLTFYVLATAPRPRPWALWPEDGKALQFTAWPFLVSFRKWGWEGYLGWRPRALSFEMWKGVFGAALRR